MTNWNDGTIHGWNGGDCPVHPETMVEVWFRGLTTDTIDAGAVHWKHLGLRGDIIAFRVVKPYVEPRVIWVNEYKTGSHIAHDTRMYCTQMYYLFLRELCLTL